MPVSPDFGGLPVTRALTMSRVMASRPGLSQYCADSPDTLTTTTDGSSSPSGNYASVKVFQSSFFFSASSTTWAEPVRDSHALVPA